MKKGFTLVELLAVIILIGVIALISYPIIGNLINDGKQKAYEKQISELERVSYIWITKNTGKLSKEDGSQYKLSFEELNKEELTSAEQIINPKNNAPIPGCILVTYSAANNIYSANYDESC